MMEFIVLGQIPGTHIQLTYVGFWVVMILVIAGAAAYVYRVHNVRVRKHLQQQFDVISLRNLDRA